ncbi:MAG: PQQ-like beta-propeller repeat protein [Verrucomicrobiales bacterium]|nr:PQQ-like beta-propeller repeat protein [Verrucomicrobiales bacterium]
MRHHLFHLAATSALCLTATAISGEWNRFRGPNGTGLGEATNLPARWETADFAWTLDLPGPGHSSPVFRGDRLFVNCASPEDGAVLTLAVDANTGRLLWRKAFGGGGFVTHRNNTLASSTPATDARHVYVAHQAGDQVTLYALDHAGETAWKFPLGNVESQHGFGHSPIVHRDLVIYSKDGINPGRIVALDAATGTLRWEVPRSGGRADYSTPCVHQPTPGPALLIFNTAEDAITAVEATTGRVAWVSPPVLDKRSVSSPIVADGLLISSCGSGGGGNYVVALRPPSTADAAPEKAWEIRRSAPYVPTPLALGQWLFLWSDGGVVSCVATATGDPVWRERVGGDYFSSPVFADGKLYNVSTAGQIVAIEAGPAFKLLGRTELGEVSHATPAVALGRLYVRTLTRIHCLPPVR